MGRLTFTGMLCACSILLTNSASAAPIRLLLEGGTEQIATGASSQYAFTTVGRAMFDFQSGTVLRQGEVREESSEFEVTATGNYVTTEGGNAIARATAGDDVALAEITFEGEEINAPGLPLTSAAFDWQTLVFNDPGLSPGDDIQVDITYSLRNTIALPGPQDPEFDYRAELMAQVSIFDSNPTPANIPFPNFWDFNAVFDAELEYDSTDFLDFLAVDNIVNASQTTTFTVGSEYLVRNFAAVIVYDAEVGQTFSAFADPIFSFENCDLCVNPSALRSITAPVPVATPEPAALAMLLAGLLAMRFRRGLA